MAQVMEPGSAIVATASLAGLVAMPLDPVYTLTKHAVVGFVRASRLSSPSADHDQRALPGFRRHADRRAELRSGSTVRGSR
jgi:hypothetical protein